LFGERSHGTLIGNHSFRGTGITAFLKNGGAIENAAAMVNHTSTRTTQLYDRRRDDVSPCGGVGAQSPTSRKGPRYTHRTETEALLKGQKPLKATVIVISQSVRIFWQRAFATAAML
jgi:hypothetical protein